MRESLDTPLSAREAWRQRRCNCYTFEGGKKITSTGRTQLPFLPHLACTYVLLYVQRFTSSLRLRPGMRVLDVGCGTGGSAFHLARKFGAEVVGIDLSTNMLDIAEGHRREMEKEVLGGEDLAGCCWLYGDVGDDVGDDVANDDSDDYDDDDNGNVADDNDDHDDYDDDNDDHDENYDLDDYD